MEDFIMTTDWKAIALTYALAFNRMRNAFDLASFNNADEAASGEADAGLILIASIPARAIAELSAATGAVLGSGVAAVEAQRGYEWVTFDEPDAEGRKGNWRKRTDPTHKPIICPHCGAQMGWMNVAYGEHEFDCDICGRLFVHKPDSDATSAGSE